MLGRGAFGTVYRARFEGERGFSKRVALKVLNTQVIDLGDVACRLRDEARMMGLLRHRAIVGADRLACLGGRWAVVMEYVEGVDLGRIVARGPIPLGPALEIVGEVAAALDAALTTAGPDGRPLRLVHRDLKPSNLMVTAYGEVKILDFGGARADFGEREAETRNFTIGSLAYMAPERLDFRDCPASDVYSLGAILFELVVGERFGRTSMSVDRHMDKVGPALEAFANALPKRDPEPVYLLSAMLAHDEEQRPTAREVEQGCLDLARHFGRERLRRWADGVVPPLLKDGGPEPSDELTGSMLREQSDERSVILGPAGGATPIEEGALLSESQAMAVDDGPQTERLPPPLLPPVVPDERSQSLAGQPVPPPPRPARGSRGFTLLLLGLVVFLSAALMWMIIRDQRPEAGPVAEDVPEPAPPAAAPSPQPAQAPAAEEVSPAPVAPAHAVGSPSTAPAEPDSPTQRCPVQVSGDAERVRLVSADASATLPAQLPEGSYAIRATFDGGETITAGNVRLRAGAPVTVHCSARFKRCGAK